MGRHWPKGIYPILFSSRFLEIGILKLFKLWHVFSLKYCQWDDQRGMCVYVHSMIQKSLIYSIIGWIFMKILLESVQRKHNQDACYWMYSWGKKKLLFLRSYVDKWFINADQESFSPRGLYIYKSAGIVFPVIDMMLSLLSSIHRVHLQRPRYTSKWHPLWGQQRARRYHHFPVWPWVPAPRTSENHLCASE